MKNPTVKTIFLTSKYIDLNRQIDSSKMPKILLAPSGGKSNTDYLKEVKETGNFSRPGKWSGGIGSLVLGEGDMFAFADADKQMMIFQITAVWSKNLEQHVRPWWQQGAYKIKTVVQFGPMTHLGDLRKYNTFHELKEGTPVVGRVVHDWRPKFLDLCAPFTHPISEIKDEKTAPEGWVYFITEEPSSGWIKIGCTRNNPANRVAELQTGNPRKLVLHTSVTCTDYKKFEGYLHKCFDDKRGIGEWFKLETKDVDQLVKFLSTSPAC